MLVEHPSRLTTVLRICGIRLSRRKGSRISGEAILRKENAAVRMSLGVLER